MAAEAVPTEADLDVALPPDQDDYPTVLGVPLNRVLTIARGPINVMAGTVAAYLLVHVHFLGLFHLQHDGLAAGIAQGLVWLSTAILTDRGLAQWVSGHHLDMRLKAQAKQPVVEAVVPAFTPQVTPPPEAHPDGAVYDPDAAAPEGAVAAKPGYTQGS
jgi:hypothetical protein